MVLYFSIIMFRLYFLYLTLADWQDWYQGEESMTGCDYHEYRKDMYTDGTDGGCRDHFDFSDHLVMIYIHYICVPMFEVYCAIKEQHMDNLEQAARSVGPTVTCTGLLVALNVYVLIFTGTFFHTRLENLCGGLVACTAMCPLVLWMHGRPATTQWLQKLISDEEFDFITEPGWEITRKLELEEARKEARGKRGGKNSPLPVKFIILLMLSFMLIFLQG